MQPRDSCSAAVTPAVVVIEASGVGHCGRRGPSEFAVPSAVLVEELGACAADDLHCLHVGAMWWRWCSGGRLPIVGACESGTCSGYSLGHVL